MTDMTGLYDQSYPPSLWAPPPPATGATAGSPGTWTPAGSIAPANLAAAATIIASPTTAWTPTQRVVTTGGDNVTWNGTAWALWVAPPVPATGATAGTPGTWTPAGSAPPATVADLIAGTPNAVVASPTTLWTTGQSVATADAASAHWDGTAWVAGVAP